MRERPTLTEWHDGKILMGDCRDSLRTLDAESVQACVTSPPYFGLRDYGVEGQIGLEQTPADYVAAVVQVFREVRRVLRDDGTLWLNLGDSYANDAKLGGSSGGKHVAALHGNTSIGRRKVRTGLKPKDLIGIPWRVAFALQGFALIPAASLAQWADWLRQAREAGDWQMVQMVEDRMRASVWLDALQADGWYLRQDIIWYKPNSMPESVRDRCTNAHEYLFLLSKSERYFYDAAAIKEPAAGDPGHPRNRWDTKTHLVPGQKPQKRRSRASVPPRHARCESTQDGHDAAGRGDGLRNRRSVWTVATQPFKDAHFATFPPALIEPCVLAGSRAGDLVLDPFLGSGTTALVAQRLGRRWLGCELNPEYAAMAARRLQGKTLGLAFGVAEDAA